MEQDDFALLEEQCEMWLWYMVAFGRCKRMRRKVTMIQMICQMWWIRSMRMQQAWWVKTSAWNAEWYTCIQEALSHATDHNCVLKHHNPCVLCVLLHNVGHCRVLQNRYRLYIHNSLSKKQAGKSNEGGSHLRVQFGQYWGEVQVMKPSNQPHLNTQYATPRLLILIVRAGR